MRLAPRPGSRTSMLPGAWGKRFTITVTLLVQFCHGTLAGQRVDVGNLFQKGIESYARGDIREAIQHFSAIVDTGFVNEAVYYNLGNAYFKDGQLGKAILYYEKAGKISPRDREIRENLALARSRIVDKVESPAASAILRVLSRLREWVSPNLETVLAASLFAIANGTFSYHILRKSERHKRITLRLAMIFLSFALLLGVSNVIRIYQDATVKEAVILGEKVEVLSGPGSDHSSLFSVHEGLKVSIQNDAGEWSQIRLENGWVGWLRHNNLGII